MRKVDFKMILWLSAYPLVKKIWNTYLFLKEIYQMPNTRQIIIDGWKHWEWTINIIPFLKKNWDLSFPLIGLILFVYLYLRDKRKGSVENKEKDNITNEPPLILKQLDEIVPIYDTVLHRTYNSLEKVFHKCSSCGHQFYRAVAVTIAPHCTVQCRKCKFVDKVDAF